MINESYITGGKRMYLEKLEMSFTICKVEKIDGELLNDNFTFIARTDHELSLICQTQYVPQNTLTAEDRWSCFRIAEDASFEKYGMISFLSKIIAAEKTGVLVVATYDTDYLFIKEEKMQSVLIALISNGCEFI